MQTKLAILICVFCLSSIAEQPQTSLHDLRRVDYLQGWSPNRLIKSALNEELLIRSVTVSEIQRYLRNIGNSFSHSGRSIDDVKSSVLTRMKNDLAIAKRLNEEFASLSPLKDEITFSCKANRLVEFLTGAIDFYESHGQLIIRGSLPSELYPYWSTPRCLGDCEGHAKFHNAVDLALKASLVLTKLELEGQAFSADMDSAFVHTTPLPKGRILNGIDGLSFFYNGTLSPVEGELGFVHGGYAFGGQAQDTSSRDSVYGRQFGPQDCSSWISKILNLPEIMSTVDFAAYHKDSCGNFGNLQPAKVDSISDVQAGMILVTRRFDLEKDPTMTSTLGTSGHAQLIIEVDPKAETLLTLEYARNLPEVEGFGVRRISFAFANDVKPYFFKTLEE